MGATDIAAVIVDAMTWRIHDAAVSACGWKTADPDQPASDESQLI